MKLRLCLILFPFLHICVHGADATVDIGGLNSKREDVFDFSREPRCQKIGQDQYEVTFAAKGHCDVTVGIIDKDRKIVRHLVSGVLGSNAPEPFIKDSLEQKLIWDGKDDLERYVSSPETCRVRVSLGLKPKFDKVLFWNPKRLTLHTLGITSDADGVYLLNVEGNLTVTTLHAPADVTHILVFDHEGNYQRTILPLPKDKLRLSEYAPNPAEGQGTPAPGQPVPQAKDGPPYGLILPSGKTIVSGDQDGKFFPPWEPNAFCIMGDTLVGLRDMGPHSTELRSLCLKKDGSMPPGGYSCKPLGDRRSSGPCWMAPSPDKKWIYLSGVGMRGRVDTYHGASWSYIVKDKTELCEHAIYRIPSDFSEGLKDPFIGKHGQPGSDNDHLKFPEGVAVDKDGKIYIADTGNNRVQVFDDSGKLMKSISIAEPYQTAINEKTGAIYVLSYSVKQKVMKLIKLDNLSDAKVEAEETFENAKINLSIIPTFCLDIHAAEPTLWLTAANFHVQLWVDKGKKFELKRDLRSDLQQEWKGFIVEDNEVTGFSTDFEVGALTAEPNRPYLYIVSGRSGAGIYRENRTPRINTETGEVDLAKGMTVIGADGLAYAREENQVSRFDPVTGSPVAFDYGSGNDGKLHYAFCSGDGLGIGVSPRGEVVFHDRWPPVPGLAFETRWGNTMNLPPYMQNKESVNAKASSISGYKLRQFYPGRVYGASCAMLLFDQTGQIKTNDAIPGLPRAASGVRMDLKGNIYCGVAYPKLLDGKVIMGNSLAKFTPGSARLIVDGSGVKFPAVDIPKRPPDFKPVLDTMHGSDPWDSGPNAEHGYGARAWGEGMPWSFGGYFPSSNNHCLCLSGRFDLDLYARTFIPESHRGSISIVDTNGNFILRMGEYGNADDRGPEIRFVHCRYVAVNDSRLYINDVVNRRILSVDLKYESECETEIK